MKPATSVTRKLVEQYFLKHNTDVACASRIQQCEVPDEANTQKKRATQNETDTHGNKSPILNNIVHLLAPQKNNDDLPKSKYSIFDPKSQFDPVRSPTVLKAVFT